MCLLAVLDLQGIVVKCTAAIFFRMVDFSPPTVFSPPPTIATSQEITGFDARTKIQDVCDNEI